MVIRYSGLRKLINAMAMEIRPVDISSIAYLFKEQMSVAVSRQMQTFVKECIFALLSSIHFDLDFHAVNFITFKTATKTL